MAETVKHKKSKNKVVEKLVNTKVVSEKKKIKVRKFFCDFYICLMVTSVIVIGISYLSYELYNKLMIAPDMPLVDGNFWWGPGQAKTDVDTSIRPFKVLFTSGMEEHFRRKATLYQSRPIAKSFENTAWTYGISSESLDKAFSHWIFKYNFRERERYFNQFDHFKTNIQGLDIHFMHIKPKVKENVKVYPLLLLHGWLSSFREFYDVIPMLTSPRDRHDFVFEVIVPSLPGFGYSQASSKPGLCPVRIAVIMRNLMKRLGFHNFFVQGGDFGHSVGTAVTTLYPEEVLGFHTNFPIVGSKVGLMRTILNALWKSFTSDFSFKASLQYYIEEFGYMHIQGTKPDTIGVALNDSPAGLLAYILDRFQIFTDYNNKDLSDGGLSKYNLTDLIDNVMVYWTTESITTSMRLYKEYFNEIELETTVAGIPTPVPTWALRLKHEVVQQPDSILRWKYPNLLGSTNYEFGGHFAAFERPKHLADDLFQAVKKFVEFNRNK